MSFPLLILRGRVPPAQINYNLMTVNLFMGMTGLYQLYRVARHEMSQPKAIESPK